MGFSHCQAYRSVELSKDRLLFLGCGSGINGTWDFRGFSHCQAYRSVERSKDQQLFLGCGNGMALGISRDCHTVRPTEV